MTTGGEGGIVVTDNSELVEVCRSLRDQGRFSAENWLDHVRLGYNYKMTELQAAIGRAQLKKLPMLLEKREVLAQMYTELLKDCSCINTPYEPEKYKRSWFLYYLTFESSELRDKVQKHLADNGVESKLFFPPIPSFYEFRQRGYSVKDYPIAQEVYEKSLALPLFPTLKEKDISFICDEVRRIVKS